jgi:hypothetical protein
MASEYNNQKYHNIQSSPHSQPPIEAKKKTTSQWEPGNLNIRYVIMHYRLIPNAIINNLRLHS